MGEVVAFPGCEDASKAAGEQPNKVLVERLEELLQKAKTGEVQGMAVAYVTTSNRASTMWPSLGHAKYSQTLAAAVSDLFFSFYKMRDGC